MCAIRSLSVYWVVLFLFFVFAFAVIVSFLATTFLVLNASREIAALRSKDVIYVTEKSTMGESTVKLEKHINFLQDGIFFTQEIFKTPIVSSSLNYSEFLRGSGKADMFAGLAQIDNKLSYKAIPGLMRVMDSINSEADKRKNSYVTLFEFLEEQNIIFSHTPSIWPITSRNVTTSSFGFRRSPITGLPSYHEGVDFGAITGTVIRSTADGIVVFAGVRSGYGYLVSIDHGFGYMTRYAHNSKLLVKQGDFVKKGEVIALSGSTGRSSGAHLHYEVLYNGCPVNSFKFLPQN